jgi:hypothetical protein
MPHAWTSSDLSCYPYVEQNLKKLQNVRTRIFVRCKMLSKLHCGNSLNSTNMSHSSSPSASIHACLPHFYPQLRILFIIPQYSPQNNNTNLNCDIFAWFLNQNVLNSEKMSACSAGDKYDFKRLDLVGIKSFDPREWIIISNIF